MKQSDLLKPKRIYSVHYANIGFFDSCLSWCITTSDRICARKKYLQVLAMLLLPNKVKAYHENIGAKTFYQATCSLCQLLRKQL